MIKKEIQQDILDFTEILLGLNFKVEVFFNRYIEKNNIKIECNLICVPKNITGLEDIQKLMNCDSDTIQSIKYTPNVTNHGLSSDVQLMTTLYLKDKIVLGEFPIQLLISEDDLENEQST